MSPESFRNPVEPEQARGLRAEREIERGIITTRYCRRCGQRIPGAGLCGQCESAQQEASGLEEIAKAENEKEGAE